MRIRFQQIFGSHAGRVLEFEEGRVRIGRHPDNDIVFHSHADLDASSHHAEVRAEGGEWFVVDSGSRNGTWLRGQRVDRARLALGDEIEFGPGGPRLRVEVIEGRALSVPAGPPTRDPGLGGGQTPRWVFVAAGALGGVGIVLGVIAWWLRR